METNSTLARDMASETSECTLIIISKAEGSGAHLQNDFVPMEFNYHCTRYVPYTE